MNGDHRRAVGDVLCDLGIERRRIRGHDGDGVGLPDQICQHLPLRIHVVPGRRDVNHFHTILRDVKSRFPDTLPQEVEETGRFFRCNNDDSHALASEYDPPRGLGPA